eukprot:CAMPEP_0175148484 /NCGR_PEP_ID=MMETSP0087-20121206/16651_1 /TAXON_ID=136419 /ORGANISM="Unknown Unknown, Strain D1" /LENGTH=245 /DNA_ID=CAMNT_0016433945 /DNA_START=188 /DNA_END=925 /DNA_ORIENTATION=-
MTTAHALMNHMYGVHKETLSKVANAKPGRDSVELAIYGMSGVPAEVIAERKAKKKESSSEEESSDEESEEEAPPPPPPSQQPGAPPQIPGAPGQFPGQFPPPYGMPGYPQPYGMPGMMGMPGYPPMGFQGQYPGAPPMGNYPGMGRGGPRPPVPPAHTGAPMPPGRGAPAPPPPAAKPAPGSRVESTETEKGQSAKVIFVYKSDTLSMEETRAMQDKYAFKDAVGDGQRLAQSIQARLAKLQGNA